MITGKLEPYPIFRKSAGLVGDPVTRRSTSADPVMIASGMEGSISVVPSRHFFIKLIYWLYLIKVKTVFIPYMKLIMN